MNYRNSVIIKFFLCLTLLITFDCLAESKKLEHPISRAYSLHFNDSIFEEKHPIQEETMFGCPIYDPRCLAEKSVTESSLKKQ